MAVETYLNQGAVNMIDARAKHTANKMKIALNIAQQPTRKRTRAGFASHGRPKEGSHFARAVLPWGTTSSFRKRGNAGDVGFWSAQTAMFGVARHVREMGKRRLVQGSARPGDARASPGERGHRASANAITSNGRGNCPLHSDAAQITRRRVIVSQSYWSPTYLEDGAA